MQGSGLPNSRISSQFSDPIKNESLKNLARRLQSLDSSPISFVRTLYGEIVAGRLNREDPQAKIAALESLDDIRSIEQQFDDINTNKRTFGTAYLTDTNIIYYWTKMLALTSQLLDQHPEDPLTVASVGILDRIALRMTALETSLMKDASRGVLNDQILASIGERWARLDRMAASYSDSIPAFRKLNSWCVITAKGFNCDVWS